LPEAIVKSPEAIVNKIGCERELETLAAVSDGTWPERSGEELHTHVLACSDCSEMITVAGALLEDRSQTARRATVPSAGSMWWRMQLRSRQDNARIAARKMAAIQVAAFVTVFGLAIGAMIAFAPSLSRSLNPFNDLASFESIFQSASSSALQWGVPLLLALAIWIALTPIAVWLAVTED
jgi:hypothetical protein